ncbi:tRNA dihydrouridine synthase DusB [Proteinivorax hydrogeniformans]|uniref:tRNA-dihydrouridine synthase n=1 Tax=Proteinivorax hydrogeniformans TaxID=1826727 RepID=A0AAU8HTE2_9FIRM
MDFRATFSKNPLVLAPMAGVTDYVYRNIVKQHNCGLMYTEMVSLKGLIYDNKKTKKILDFTDQQRPIVAQVFGSKLSDFERGIPIVESSKVDAIDINMGCPTPKIVKNGDGAALLKDIYLAEKILLTTIRSTKCPVTIKIRLGWDESNIVAKDFVKMAENAGAAAVAIHGRTREQFYSGSANWDRIAEAKADTSIPILANGDVFKPEDVVKIMEYTGCEGVMIGRGAMGNPWIFSNSLNLLEKGHYKQPSPPEIIEQAIVHLQKQVDYFGETLGVKMMRKHIAWYLKGLSGSAKVKREIHSTDKLKCALEILEKHKKQLENS